MKEIYELAETIRGSTPARSIELGRVKALEPLTLEIGGASYAADKWRMYAPFYALKEIEAGKGMLYYSGSSSEFNKLETETLEAAALYAVGDLLAVQEMDGGKAFIILGKIREVT